MKFLLKITNGICIWVFTYSSITAQVNLVLNPSFEQHTQCPNSISQISYCNNWGDGAVNSTCDYFSALNCTGNFAPPLIRFGGPLIWYQKPLSGKSFAGFIPFYNSWGSSFHTEFLQGAFNSVLTVNKLYYVEFYINYAVDQEYFIHDIAALITDTTGLVDHNNLQFYHPQILPLQNKIYRDTTNWMRINGYYTAHGGENYITIGNYTPYGQELKDSLNSYVSSEAYYFIDSVGIYEVTHLDTWNAGPDKYINYGDSVQIGNPNTDLSMFDWINSVNDYTFLSDSTEAHPWSKPWQTTTYYVTKTQGSNIFRDTVTVFVTGGNGIKQLTNNLQVNIYPNPANSKIYVEAKEIKEVKLFDLLGNEIISTTKEKEIDMSNLREGIYFIQVNRSESIFTKKIIIQH
jgi:hypothetical protein